MSTLGALRVLTLDVHIPPSGAWFGTVTLNASELPPIGPTTLTIGDLVLVGGVIRADFDDHPGGGRVVATVRGGAGWRLPVTHAGSYGTTAGVRLSTVLADLAAMAGEAYVAPADVSLGVAYAWQMHTPLGPVHGEHVLADLVDRGFLPTWRVEPFTGRTVFSVWPAIGPADGRGRVVDRAGSRGRRTVGLDVQVAAFLPGATLEGVTIARTYLHESAGSLQAEVYEDGAIPTAKRSMYGTIVGLFPWLAGFVSVVGAKGKGLAIRSASGLLHLAGGPSDPPVHRKGDAGTAGTIELLGAPGAGTGFKWTAPDGTFVTFTFAFTGGAVVVTGVDQLGPMTPAAPHALPTKSTVGSDWVTCK